MDRTLYSPFGKYGGMKMNILLVNGSPKGERSNTLRLANAFFEGICYAQKDCLPKIERLNIA